jgi:hypothetical protein
MEKTVCETTTEEYFRVLLNSRQLDFERHKETLIGKRPDFWVKVDNRYIVCECKEFSEGGFEKALPLGRGTVSINPDIITNRWRMKRDELIEQLTGINDSPGIGVFGNAIDKDGCNLGLMDLNMRFLASISDFFFMKDDNSVNDKLNAISRVTFKDIKPVGLEILYNPYLDDEASSSIRRVFNTVDDAHRKPQDYGVQIYYPWGQLTN